MLKRGNKISSISGYHLKRSSTTSTRFPELEAALLCWLDKTIVSEISVTQSMIREEATRIAQRQQLDLSSLTYSNGRLARFQARHCVKSRFDHVEAGSCDPVAVVRGRIACEEAIRCYAKRDVYRIVYAHFACVKQEVPCFPFFIRSKMGMPRQQLELRMAAERLNLKNFDLPYNIVTTKVSQ